MMKSILLLAITTSISAISNAAPMEALRGEYGQLVNGFYRGVAINKDGKAGHWLARECDPIVGKCVEERSKRVKVKKDGANLISIERPDRSSDTVNTTFDDNWVTFELAADGSSLFHPSQGDYVRRK
jgi:hypothetical protein